MSKDNWMILYKMINKTVKMEKNLIMLMIKENKKNKK
jgi:hypothetical protein